MRGQGEKTLKEVLEQMVQTYNMEPKMIQANLKGQWEEIMGAVVAKHTERLILNKKCLYLKMSSAPLKQELFYGREQLVTRINEHFGKEVVEMVIFS